MTNAAASCAPDYPHMIAPIDHIEPVPRRVRAMLGGAVVFDTAAALYVWEWPNYPQFYIPLADVSADVLADEQHPQTLSRGLAHRHGLRVGALSRTGAARVYRDDAMTGLANTVRFEWEALDAWFEEDEEVFVHPRNPYTRVDALHSTRTVRIELDGVVLAESNSPVMVFETGLPTRYYIDRAAVNFEHLIPTTTVSSCPYKGKTSGYWSVRTGSRVHPDLAWAYDFPTRQLQPISGLVAFYNERVDITLDSHALTRPVTHFFQGASTGRREPPEVEAVVDAEVLAFDLYGTLVDPIAVDIELRAVLGDVDGRDVARLWRAKQVDYSFRLTMMGRYQDFQWVTARALHDVISALGLALSETETARLVELYHHVPPFPDTRSGLQALQGAGHRLAVLSNGTPSMIENCLTNNGLRDAFSALISADDVRAFKPSAHVYHHAAKTLGRPIGNVRLISSNPFDVIGAKTAGMRTAWVNRAGTSFDSMGEPPDITVASLTDLRDSLGLKPAADAARRTANGPRGR